MRRRDFIALVWGAMVSPLTARAQQLGKTPIIGLLSSMSFQSYAVRVAAFQQGLMETGFVEGNNMSIEYRSADGQVEKLPALVTDLVRRQVDVIVTIGGEAPAPAAKTATSTIPIVFAAGGDPVDYGLVTSLSRPEANVTGVSFFSNELGPKRLELLREFLTQAGPVAFLMGSTSTTANAERSDKDLMLAARNMGLQSVVLRADAIQKIDEAFASIVQQRVVGLVIENDACFSRRATQSSGNLRVS